MTELIRNTCGKVDETHTMYVCGKTRGQGVTTYRCKECQVKEDAELALDYAEYRQSEQNRQRNRRKRGK